MKRTIARIVALGLTLLLCASAAAESTDAVTYTMAEKLVKQLKAGSGFTGTVTLTSTAVQGRENDAYSTVKPIVLDWTYIRNTADEEAGTPEETRINLSMSNNDYQQASAQISVQDDITYFMSSLTGEDWYELSSDTLSLSDLMATDAAASSAGAQELTQLAGLLPASLTFFANMTGYLSGGNFEGLSDSMEQYTTKIDFWLEGYRDTVQTDTREDGTSILDIEYRIPAAAVKSQVKQLLIDLMNDETLLAELSALMPESQAEQFLSPSLQPYYFYAVNELPITDDLVIHRIVSFLGETVELSVSMPLYDSKSGNMTLEYTRTQDGEDMPCENVLSLTGESTSAELSYRTYETITGTTVYQGTVRVEGTDENGDTPKTLWASFDLSSSSVTTKDLNGYETLNNTIKLSVAPGETDVETDADNYLQFYAVDLSIAMSFSSLSAKNSPTEVDVVVLLTGDDLAQEIALEFTGTTSARWTSETLDVSQAVSPADLSQEDRSALLSQAGIKAGLLFLPYVNLPQVSTDAAD